MSSIFSVRKYMAHRPHFKRFVCKISRRKIVSVPPVSINDFKFQIELTFENTHPTITTDRRANEKKERRKYTYTKKKKQMITTQLTLAA